MNRTAKFFFLMRAHYYPGRIFRDGPEVAVTCRGKLTASSCTQGDSAVQAWMRAGSLRDCDCQFQYEPSDE